MDEDHLSLVYVSLCEIHDALFLRLFQRHHPTGERLNVVNQLLWRGIIVVSVQHAGGDISFLTFKNL